MTVLITKSTPRFDLFVTCSRWWCRSTPRPAIRFGGWIQELGRPQSRSTDQEYPPRGKGLLFDPGHRRSEMHRQVPHLARRNRTSDQPFQPKDRLLRSRIDLRIPRTDVVQDRVVQGEAVFQPGQNRFQWAISPSASSLSRYKGAEDSDMMRIIRPTISAARNPFPPGRAVHVAKLAPAWPQADAGRDNRFRFPGRRCRAAFQSPNSRRPSEIPLWFHFGQLFRGKQNALPSFSVKGRERYGSPAPGTPGPKGEAPVKSDRTDSIAAIIPFGSSDVIEGRAPPPKALDLHDLNE